MNFRGLNLNLFLISILLSSIFTVSIFGINTVATGYQINDNANTMINAHGVCQRVTNNNCAGAGIFVPTKVSAEWSNFRSNKPSCIGLSSCETYSWYTGAFPTCPSRECGSGTNVYRTVECRGSVSGTVDDSFCSGVKPTTSKYCSAGSCSGGEVCGGPPQCHPFMCGNKGSSSCF